MNYSKYVNVFHGSGEVFKPDASGIASTWQPIKALCGNTHPHASIPFGQFSCGAYSGGYSSGYGNHKPNSNRPPEKYCETSLMRGFSHYHCTGTGALGVYYNYAVVSPFVKDIETTFEQKKITEETAYPSYYKARLEDETVCEVTVNENCAYHRYTNVKEKKIAIDFSNDGLDKVFLEKFYSYSEKSNLEVISDTEVQASVLMQGLTLYFYVKCENAKANLFFANEVCDNTLNLEKTKEKFGCIFNLEGETAGLRVAFSLKSFEQAKSFCQKHDSFDECQKYTENVWNEYLGAIEIEADDSEKELLYSNLYHTLIKPSDFTLQSNLFDESKPFMLGFETLWDQYKTQLPLIFTLYPKMAEKIINSYIYVGESLGHMPHTLALTNNYNLEAVQACALPEHMIIDAYYRGVKIHDKELMFKVIYTDMKRIEENLFDENGVTNMPTHLLDFVDAVSGLTEIAKEENKLEWAEKFSAMQKDRAYVFDSDTGLLNSKYEYYEGNHWNYSFRLLSNMKERIDLAGGEKNFESLLDTFFGYQNESKREMRFEGFNNETDMETPFAYHFIGKHDKISEILSLANEFMFFCGKGGIPGNNDTGGLSSLYVYNAMGIFPVTGQDLTIIGMPKFKKTTIKLANGKTLTIEKDGEGIYVDSAYFGETKLCDLSMKTSDLMSGGIIKIKMKKEVKS